jgi:outer membrane lipoprotein carrier protein
MGAARRLEAPGERLARAIALAVVLFAGVLLMSAIFIGPASAEEPSPEVEGLLARMAKSYSTIESFEADFVQTSRGMSYASPLVQKGRLAVERPQKMHWDFLEPTRQQYISDGSTFWWVDHTAKTTTVYRKMDSVLQHFFDLLTGMKNVKQNFRVSIESGEHSREGSDSLKLISRGDTSGMGTLYVHVAKATARVVAVTTVTPFGDITLLELGELTLNKKLPASHFRWTEREGFTLIEGG